MTIGTGIFLSSLVVALLILYLRTKERWNWKRIISWMTATLVGVPVVIAITFYTYNQIQNLPKPQTELWGIRLNDSEQDVKFKKGLPSVTEGDTDRNLWVYALSDEETVAPKIKTDEIYTHVYLVRFSNHHVRWVMCMVGTMPTFPNLNGITPQSSLDEIEKKLGKPNFISRSADETERWYSFDKYGVAFAFSHERMSSVSVYDPRSGPIRFKNEAK